MYKYSDEITLGVITPDSIFTIGNKLYCQIFENKKYSFNVFKAGLFSKIVDLDIYFDGYIISNNCIVLRLSNGKGFFLNHNLNPLEVTKSGEINFSMLYKNNNTFEGKYLICNKGRLFNRENGIFDINNDKVLFWQKEILRGFFIDDKFINIPDDTTIELLHLDKTPLWHFSLSVLTDLYPALQANWEVWHFVGVVEGVLWVCVDKKKDITGALLGLDTQTGKVLHFIHQVEAQTPNCVYAELPFQGNTQYDAFARKMIGFDRDYYWEIDLNILPYKAKIWNLEDELKPYYTEFPRVRGSAMNETHIFAFSGKLSDFCKNKVFAFNRQTFQIDWDYEFEYVPMKTEITETHLFVLDGNGTLHIFERE